MRRLAPLLALLPLALVGAAIWSRPPAQGPRPVATYTVAGLVALLRAHPAALRGRVVAVRGYYHHGCPYCMWDAPPSLTPGSAWGEPGIVVALPDMGPSADAPPWLTAWRALPLLGRLAPSPLRSYVPEGFTTFSGVIVPCVANTCGGPSYVIRVLPSHQ